MKLSEIPLSKVFEGVNWIVSFPEGDGADRENPFVREADSFSVADHGLFSAVIKLGDGSEHPCLVVKSFAEGGLHTDTYVHTKNGWLNVFAEGFNRAMGRYPADIYPYEIFIGSPWRGDKEMSALGASRIQEQMKHFEESVGRLKGATR